MATKKTATIETMVEIKPLDTETIPIKIIGDTPLIVHAWSDKAKRMMLEAQTNKTKTKAREIRKPADDFVNSLYWICGRPEYDETATDEEIQKLFDEAVKSGAKWGFPAGAIKIAANSAAYRAGWVSNQMGLRGTYFINRGDKLVEIKGSIPTIREDMTRVGQGKVDLRYRGEFSNWYMDLELEYNKNGKVTLEQIINCINLGGYACGLGEWRPERDGDFGRFHVESAFDIKKRK